MTGLVARFLSLASHRCYERRVLLDLAGLRNGLVGLGTVALFLWQVEALGAAAAVVAVPCNAVLIALVSADFLEHYGRGLILGYTYNPNVSAIGELEGSMCPTDAEAESAWRATMFTRLAPGDDPGSGHYPYPAATLCGRLRALGGG